jgi:hypothetical protein
MGLFLVACLPALLVAQAMAPATQNKPSCISNIYIYLDLSRSLNRAQLTTLDQFLQKTDALGEFDRYQTENTSVVIPFGANLGADYRSVKSFASLHDSIRQQELHNPKLQLDQSDIVTVLLNISQRIRSAPSTMNPNTIFLIVSDFAHDVTPSDDDASIEVDIHDWRDRFQNIAENLHALIGKSDSPAILLLPVEITSSRRRGISETVIRDIEKIAQHPVRLPALERDQSTRLSLESSFHPFQINYTLSPEKISATVTNFSCRNLPQLEAVLRHTRAPANGSGAEHQPLNFTKDTFPSKSQVIFKLPQSNGYKDKCLAAADYYIEVESTKTAATALVTFASIEVNVDPFIFVEDFRASPGTAPGSDTLASMLSDNTFARVTIRKNLFAPEELKKLHISILKQGSVAFDFEVKSTLTKSLTQEPGRQIVDMKGAWKQPRGRTDFWAQTCFSRDTNPLDLQLIVSSTDDDHLIIQKNPMDLTVDGDGTDSHDILETLVQHASIPTFATALVLLIFIYSRRIVSLDFLASVIAVTGAFTFPTFFVLHRIETFSRWINRSFIGPWPGIICFLIMAVFAISGYKLVQKGVILPSATRAESELELLIQAQATRNNSTRFNRRKTKILRLIGSITIVSIMIILPAAIGILSLLHQPSPACNIILHDSLDRYTAPPDSGAQQP